jgi:outer membrane receptor for ferrienterochelin and colicins
MSVMKWLLLFIGCCIPFGMMAQTGDDNLLEGVVLEENAKGEFIPLYGASVYWAGTTLGTTTNETGHFSLEDDHTNHKLVISYVGYAPDTLTITEHGKLNIILSHQTLDEFTVTAREKTTNISYMNPLLTQNMDEEELFKAACCNLSESFETNPSVDVSFTDAVTGTRQIRMLGLDGKYSMLSQENMPGVRGVSSIQGLTFTPGAWIQSIQITKGTGSVINGYESMTGQINTELKKPSSKEIFYLNGYYNQSGRRELNFNTRKKDLGKKKRWSTALLMNYAERPSEFDNNDDGFLDNPKTLNFNGMNRWKYSNNKGLMGQIGVQGVYSDVFGGQLGYDFDLNQFAQSLYGVKITTRRIQGFTKTGYVFPKKRYKSIGLQTQWTYNNMETFFGERNYDAIQRSAYSNLIYQSIIGNSNHKFKTGLSFVYDQYQEKYQWYYQYEFDFTEIVPGAFFEYSFDHGERFNLVAGLRADHHNVFGAFVTPRLHTRFAITDRTVIRASGGRGQRTANVLAENMGYMASSRRLKIVQDFSSQQDGGYPYGLLPEIGWNMGVSLTKEFRLDYRDGQIVIDAFRTQFTRQTIVDVDQNPQEILIYNRENGAFGSSGSFATSVQAQVDYELLKRLDIRLAYRWLNQQTDYLAGAQAKPLLAEHRTFANIGYATRSDWKFDYTLQWQGQKRLPATLLNPEPFQLASESPAFYLMNAQVTKKIGKYIEAYIGMENLLNFKQENPILAADDPTGNYFDASMVWGPIFGRTTYAGFRFVIKEKIKTISDS